MKRNLLLLITPLLITACEKSVALDDSDPGGNLRVSVLTMEQISRAFVGDVASRLQVCVYDTEGKRVKQVAQEKGSEGYGSVSMSLADGEYTLMALAHNGEGMATTTDVSRIAFKDNRCTDTFCKAQTLTVSGATTTGIIADRCVARVRLIPTDTPPSAASRIKIYYTGGSSTLDALTAMGAVNSRQTEYRTPAQEYYIYTIPRSDNTPLKITISALDANDNVLSEQVLTDIPIKAQYQTSVTTQLFDGSTSGGSDSGITITIPDTPWQELQYIK